MSHTGTTLQFALSDPTSKGFIAADLVVEVQGRTCSNVAGTIASLTCTMTANTDGSPTLVAGDVTPLVHLKQYGIAGLASGVSPLSVPLLADSLSSTSGGNNGGYLVTLTGSGFPLDPTKMTIEMCQKQATVKSSTNINVQFYIPSCGTLTA